MAIFYAKSREGGKGGPGGGAFLPHFSPPSADKVRAFLFLFLFPSDQVFQFQKKKEKKKRKKKKEGDERAEREREREKVVIRRTGTALLAMTYSKQSSGGMLARCLSRKVR